MIFSQAFFKGGRGVGRPPILYLDSDPPAFIGLKKQDFVLTVIIFRMSPRIRFLAEIALFVVDWLKQHARGVNMYSTVQG